MQTNNNCEACQGVGLRIVDTWSGYKVERCDQCAVYDSDDHAVEHLQRLARMCGPNEEPVAVIDSRPAKIDGEGKLCCPHCGERDNLRASDYVPRDFEGVTIDEANKLFLVRFEQSKMCWEGATETHTSCGACGEAFDLPEGWAIDE